MAETQERVTDIGPPHYEQFLPPVIKNNYGKWKYHEVLKPGVMVHVGESGDELYTVRAGSPRLLSIDKIRQFCDLADKYCDGYLRFTEWSLLVDVARWSESEDHRKRELGHRWNRLLGPPTRSGRRGGAGPPSASSVVERDALV